MRSGLDDTMRQAFGELLTHLEEGEKVEDLRTAAFVVSVEKIARNSIDIGGF